MEETECVISIKEEQPSTDNEESSEEQPTEESQKPDLDSTSKK